MKSFKVVAVIPAFNEEDQISNVVRKTKSYVDYVIVVDDGSTDNTAQFAKEAGAKLISLRKNRGKGVALRTGFQEAFKLNPEYIITLDSDGQHKPEQIPDFLRAIKNCDMVIGSRFKGELKTSRRNTVGNIGLTFGVNILSFGLDDRKWLTDTECGFKIYRTTALKKLDLRGEKFEIEAEQILEAARKNLRIKEIPIYVPTKVKGATVIDGMRNALYITGRRLFG